MMPPGLPGITAARSASAYSLSSGLMRTHSREVSACAFRNAAVQARELAFSPVGNAYSGSIRAMWAVLAAAVVIFFYLFPGSNRQERAMNPSVAWDRKSVL